MRQVLFVYGMVCYLIFFCTFLYAAGFTGNLWVPKSIDSGEHGSVLLALVVNTLLLGVFAVQHSVMARQEFKQKWTVFVPKEIERSTYVLLASLALILMFASWRPIGGVIWDFSDSIVGSLFWLLFVFGWLIVLASTFMINHFELFGLNQVYAHWRGGELPDLSFRTPYLYNYVRHPIYLGFILAFWSAPVMTGGHLLFALGATGYILVGIFLEEKDLIAAHGDLYKDYKSKVSMLIPMRPKA